MRPAVPASQGIQHTVVSAAGSLSSLNDTQS